MTAGLWALEALSPRLYKELTRLGARLAAGLADGARAAGVPLQVNAFGSTLTPFFTSSPVRDFDSALTCDTEAYGRSSAKCWRAAFTCRRRNSRRGSYRPPTPTATSTAKVFRKPHAER